MADEGESRAAGPIADENPSPPSDQSANQVLGSGEKPQDDDQQQQEQHTHPQQHQRMNEALSWLLQWPLIMHAALVLAALWLMSLLGLNYPVAYVLGFIFLFLVESRHREKLVKRIRYEARKHAAQRQPLSDFESVRWLNHTLEKAWPVFLEKFASREFLAPMMPFFIEKYKPWTVHEATLQSFSLGRSPPFLAELRAVDSSATGDDLVLEATMQFFGADDMSAVLSCTLKKRLGGITSKLHISKLHVEGKVRLGMRFQDKWPFLNRLRISFDGAPYLQIEARPLTNYGVDVAELPGIAGWLDTMLMDALEDSVVKPNMLVINVEKIASCWGSTESVHQPLDKSAPVAYAIVEVLEAQQLKPADVNGLADPFVKLTLNANRSKTSIKWKTLNPTWKEKFRLPVKSWEVQNRLIFQVRDKDTFRDDNLGYWDESLAKFRDGNRHETCVPLRGVKTGRLTFAITIEEVQQEVEEPSPGAGGSSSDMDESFGEPLGGDEVVVIETGVSAPGIFSILRPGKAVQKRWRGRRGRKFDETIEMPDKTLFSGRLDECDEESSGGSDEERDKDSKAGRKRFWRWSNRASRDKKSLSGEFVTMSDTGGQVGAVMNSDSIAEKVEEVEKPGGPPVETEAAGQLDSPRLEEGKRDDSMRSQEDSDTQQASPGRRSMRDRARSVVKQAEKTATHIGHTIWRKRSGKLSPKLSP